jgi:hypothetical protein
MDPNPNPDGDRNGTNYYERFHLNQFYNAAEDEQHYTDEYTHLLHSYNEFIVNGNTMFLRMEQALRANLERSIVRQSFYYHRHNDIRRITNPNDAIYNSPPAQRPVPGPVPAPVPAAAPAPTVVGPSGPPGPPPPTDNTRLSNAFARLLTNYLTTENSRNERSRQGQDQNPRHDPGPRVNQPNANLFSMLYTYTQPITRTTNNGADTRGPAIPTPEQIRRATLNTTYSNIINPVNNTCPISRDEFEDESEITMIRGCNHIFNRFSLREWFVNNSTCPMCRNDIRNYRDTGAGAGAGAGATGPRPSAVNDIYSRIMDNSSNFMNMEINNVTNDSVTFSYDLPPLYNRYSDEDIFHDILNAAGGASAPSRVPDDIPRRNRYRDDGDGDDGDDYMEVD